MDGAGAFGGLGEGANYDLARYTNNIENIPGFVNLEWDFHLSVLSPCINTGNPDTLGLFLPITDQDGN